MADRFSPPFAPLRCTLLHDLGPWPLSGPPSSAAESSARRAAALACAQMLAFDLRGTDVRLKIGDDPVFDPAEYAAGKREQLERVPLTSHHYGNP